MLGKAKKTKGRKNRYKKKTAAKGPGLMHRLGLALKWSGLVLVLLMVSGLFIFVYSAVTQSDYFRTRAIIVKGLSRLTQEMVLVQAGLTPGENLLAVNLHLVRKRLLGHPWIAAAQVSREIPETIGIQIEEHVPLAVVDMGRRFLLNTHGRIFKELGDEDVTRLPVISGIRYTDISLGEDALSPSLTSVLEVLALSRSKGAALAYPRIEQVIYDAELGVTLVSRKGHRSYALGWAPFESKYRRLEQLLPRLNRNRDWRDYRAVDLNNPDRIVVQLGKTSTSRKGA